MSQVNASTLLAHLTEIVEERNALRQQNAQLVQQHSDQLEMLGALKGEVTELYQFLKATGCSAIQAPNARIIPAAITHMTELQARVVELEEPKQAYQGFPTAPEAEHANGQSLCQP